MLKKPGASTDAERPAITKVLSAEKVSVPEIHKWQFLDLEQDAKNQLDSVRADVLEKIKQEIQPKLAQQTAILKREAYEEAKQQGYEAGYQAGFETGQALGIEKAQQQAAEALAPKVANMEQVLAALVRPQAYIETRVFEQVAQIALALAEKITEQAIALDKTKVLRFIEQAVALLPDDQAQVDVELHPDDLEFIQYYQAPPSAHWVLKANPQLQLGECKVKKLNSVVHYRWRERLDALLSQTGQLVAAQLEPGETEDHVDEPVLNSSPSTPS
ncbi:FliH/SctL family protein [Thiomicrospira microaerophila]|uniref:FliH/SctL family protein n=1 Tax=Thiomicrospira microaerophila TaxID=406020 RepID=UPI0005C8966F|nr:FliH/SctL family protein [Thiomicrospira microaerophila]